MADSVKTVIGRLNSQINAIENRSMAGMLEAGLIVERQAKVWTPREYGNLIGSAYTRKSMDEKMTVEVGYSASYAVYVHENLQQKWKGKPRSSGLGVYWGPAGRPRFLYQAYVTKQKEVLAAIAKHARIKT